MNNSPFGPKGRRGQILVGVILLLVVLLITVPALVRWIQEDARVSVKDRKTTSAFNLAETAVDRGYWKAKSSTGTITSVFAGTPLTGYNFDTTYTDVAGGTYRISITSTSNPSKSITIIGEGRDASTNEVRSITAVFQNRTIYSPLLSQGNINYNRGVGIFWGPMMSQGTITLDNTTAKWYFPRKFARASVVGTAGNPRDTTWPLPPNTDNTEWWANYPYVPELPILDFVTLRQEAAATNTLNVYGCALSTKHTDPTTGATLSGKAPWAATGTCPTAPSGPGSPHYSGSGGLCVGSSCHFGNSWNHPKSAKNQPNTDYVWYWDGDVTLSGGNGGLGTSVDSGLRGTIIVRGNLTIQSSGDYNYTSTSVPPTAWEEHSKLTSTLKDTAATKEYPGDIGLHKSTGTWRFGTDQFCFPTNPPNGTTCGFQNTVGIRGFVYVGGNLIIKSFMDVNGAVWVNGSVSATCPGSDPTCQQSFCGIFYDENLSVPVLNVILVRVSWKETSPNNHPWL